jgi:hypothetical protein
VWFSVVFGFFFRLWEGGLVLVVGGGSRDCIGVFGGRSRFFWGFMERSLAFTCIFLCWRLAYIQARNFQSYFGFHVLFRRLWSAWRRVAGYEILDSVDGFGKSGCTRPIGWEEGSL